MQGCMGLCPGLTHPAHAIELKYRYRSFILPTPPPTFAGTPGLEHLLPDSDQAGHIQGGGEEAAEDGAGGRPLRDEPSQPDRDEKDHRHGAAGKWESCPGGIFTGRMKLP